MPGPIVNSITINAQEKDAFNWGFRAGTAGTGTPYRDAATEAFMSPTPGMSTSIIGRRHTKFKNTNPPEAWERLRTYMSFYTSGFLSGDWVESVKLRMFVQIAQGVVSDSSPVKAFPDFGTDWNLSVFTISGGVHVLQQPYFPPSGGLEGYGFGDEIEWRDWGAFDFPTGTSNHILEEYIASGTFWNLGETYSTDISRDSVGKIHTFRDAWIEINLPIDKINNLGETHLRLVHLGERANLAPLDGNGPWQHHEYATIGASEHATQKPYLQINYVTPSTYHMGELRMCDLSIHRFIQQVLANDSQFSDVAVLDAYPDDEVFNTSRSVSIEFVSGATDILELGKRTENNRRFFIDLVCDRRGELLDLQEKISRVLHGGTYLRNFKYGFVNPPPVGLIRFHNLRVFEMPDIDTPDRSKFHTVVSVDAITTRSGFLWIG